MKKLFGFLVVISMVGNSYALTDTMQKVYQGVQDLKTNLQNAAGAFSAGDTNKAAEHLNKAVAGVRDAASEVLSAKNAAKDIAPKIETAKEALKTVSDDASKLHDTAQKAKDAVKSAVENHIKNDPQAAQAHAETAYDLLNEVIPNLESLKNRLFEIHQKAQNLGETVQSKPATGTGTFGGWFE